ncbi:MAG TPA: hypothetical protein VLT86_02370 [Vicinamibacterales bacterium]|nr:hypothetical protein [Vicinamibacterales bacterium]
MKIKIHGGTAREGEPSLCLTCRHASVVRGQKSADQIVRCGRLEERIPFRVSSCTDYVSHDHPSLWHMEDIAWVLRTDPKRKQIGFVRGKDLPFKDRLLLDDE